MQTLYPTSDPRYTSLNRSQQFTLDLLKEGPKCLGDFARYDFSAYSQRMGELRRMGYRIVKRTCQRHEHPYNPAIPEYVLVGDAT